MSVKLISTIFIACNTVFRFHVQRKLANTAVFYNKFEILIYALHGFKAVQFVKN